MEAVNILLRKQFKYSINGLQLTEKDLAFDENESCLDEHHIC